MSRLKQVFNMGLDMAIRMHREALPGDMVSSDDALAFMIACKVLYAAARVKFSDLVPMAELITSYFNDDEKVKKFLLKN